MTDRINETNDDDVTDEEQEHEIQFSWQCKCGELNEDHWYDAQEKRLWSQSCSCGRCIEILLMPKKE